VGPAEKADFQRWYCTVPPHRLSARAGLRLNPRRPAPEELVRAGREHPLLRLVAAPGT